MTEIINTTELTPEQQAASVQLLDAQAVQFVQDKEAEEKAPI